MSRRIKSVESRAYAKIIAFPRKNRRGKKKKQTNKRTNERTNERMNGEGKKRRKKERKIPWQQYEAGIGAHGNRGTTRRCVKPNIRIPDRIINREFNQVYSVTRVYIYISYTRVADIISLIARTDERTYVYNTFSNRPVNYAFIFPPYILSPEFSSIIIPTNLLPCKFHGFQPRMCS